MSCTENIILVTKISTVKVNMLYEKVGYKESTS